jgi:excisionase family DNA binding protein
MSLNLIARYNLREADRAATALSADAFLRGLPADVTFTYADGTSQAVAIPAAAAGMIGAILAKLSVAETVAVLADDAEISPEDAAAIPGVSRPLVRRRMDSGRLPFRRVGAHRRLKLSDVLALKQAEAPVRDALIELQADTEELTARGL